MIGRKGTGKTAVASFIESKANYRLFVKRLSLKDFPFESLYHLSDATYTPPNQYITLWKYVIYSTLIYMMADNEQISADLTSKIKSSNSFDPSAALQKSIRQWTSSGFDFGLAGIKFSAKFSNDKSEVDWAQRIELLEAAAIRFIDDSHYYILFDELDEDYKYQSVLNTNPRYLELISGLFKATQDVLRSFYGCKARVAPIVFLRDDIFDMIRDPDKTKWLDLTLRLRWTDLTISPLLSHRIMRAHDRDARQAPFAHAWLSIMESEKIQRESTKSIEIYEWITRHTMFRPRDYIKYIQLCADYATKAEDRKIGPRVALGQAGNYSQYLRSELTDEIHSILPTSRKFSI